MNIFPNTINLENKTICKSACMIECQNIENPVGFLQMIQFSTEVGQIEEKLRKLHLIKIYHDDHYSVIVESQ